MGVVWKARDTRLDRDVAIKFLSPELAANAQRLARFEREARLLASINHPNVATVYGLDEQDGTRYLALELIPGEDLAHRLERGNPPVEEALSVAAQVAAALEATHEKGVIHRDLKPANVYVTPSGVIKVLDFGIARDLEANLPDRETTPTQPGTILGTVDYMSPEQARGKELDARTDLWSFGCLLFRLLAGAPAFDGETRWDKLVAVMRREPDWERLPATTPEPVGELLHRCLEKDPARRLADAAEARRTLEAALAALSETGSTRRPRWPAVSVGIVVLVFAAIVGAALLWPPWSGTGGRAPAGPARPAATHATAAATPPADNRRSLAVLPFESMGGGEENDAFAAGIHDDILNRLAKIGDLKVISRTSVMEYRGTSKNLAQIGQELDVATVLEGAVSRAGRHVRVNLRLLDTADEQTLWAESYDREISVEHILEIQSDVAERVAAALRATLSAEERKSIGEMPTTDLAAYDDYLEGLEYLNRPGQLPENLLAARERFESAVAKDPRFALAYTALSRASRNFYWMGGGDPNDLPAALQAAQQALAIAPDLPEAHLALGTLRYVQRDYPAALDELRIAEQGLPGNPELVRWKGYLMRRRGEWSEGLRDLERARALDPRDPEATNEVAMTLLLLRRYDEARTYFDRALVLAPDYANARIFRAWLLVARDGTPESVGEALERVRAIPPSPWKYAQAWQIAICAGDYDGAVELVAGRQRISTQWQEYPEALLVGWARKLQGRDAEAQAALEQARAELEALVAERPDEAKLHSALGLAYAGLGRSEDALREGELSVELLPIEKDALVGTWMLHDLAWNQAACGRKAEALDSLERVLSVPSLWSADSVALDPRFASLHKKQGFRKLLKKSQEEG